MSRTNRRNKTDEQRFWEKVARKPVGCWEWTAGKITAGYGVLVTRKDGKTNYIRAHRYSWELANGPIPPGLYVCHHCDNPGCVNPEHLFLGTNQDNMKDMASKGRGNQGERHNNRKLSRDQVTEIRRKWQNGVPQGELATEYTVSNTCIHQVVRRKTWKLVTSS